MANRHTRKATTTLYGEAAAGKRNVMMDVYKERENPNPNQKLENRKLKADRYFSSVRRRNITLSFSHNLPSSPICHVPADTAAFHFLFVLIRESYLFFRHFGAPAIPTEASQRASVAVRSRETRAHSVLI